ncbi:MAG: phosphoenolpyruvate synthase [Gammaproteobacteria bacterium]|nr:phosphoenolpyruvate synthase [Gammaproteobacteria bacterium]
MNTNTIPFSELRLKDIPIVGGKNASLGEMIAHFTVLGINVPDGFATTASAYRAFLSQGGLKLKIDSLLATLDSEDIPLLKAKSKQIRNAIRETPLQPDLEADIRNAFATLAEGKDISVAVRSSATAEDLPEASFAGQQETVLNVRGIKNVLLAVQEVFASLFTERAISYRVHKGFSHSDVALSVGIQHMVRSDKGASGVMFTLDTESGFDQVVLITSSYGLGETVVQGTVNPDEFYVYKPSLRAGKFAILKRGLGTKAIKMIYANTHHTVKTVKVQTSDRQRFSLTDEDVHKLTTNALIIEDHYKRPMDIEWARDGETGKLYILQARPETVKSRQKKQILERYHLKEKGTVKVTGRSIGQKIACGPVKIVPHLKDIHKVEVGDVLVTDMTDPDWEPIMRRASAIVTNRGGRTCHAAIIARELGIAAIVGCGNATEILQEGEWVTVSCAEGETGSIYGGKLPFERTEQSLERMPKLPFKIMMNVGNPERAFDFRNLPHQGVGLARLEFIINHMIGVHPKALLNFSTLAKSLQQKIRKKISGYADPVRFYVERLSEGIATITAAFAPERVIVRLSDFKSNEYANLLGGKDYEPHEDNPMLGWRGACRYVSSSFQDCFALECEAIRKVRNDMGLTNCEVMIPFVRTVAEAKQVVDLLQANGLKRGENGLKIIMMCEIPSNALLAEEFLQYFDGFSIGSNDLTQLTLGLDRDSGLIAHLFDERDKAVKALLHPAIRTCKKLGKSIGICGQGPSDHLDFAQWLMEEGIDSVSLNPDSILETWLFLASHLSQ